MISRTHRFHGFNALRHVYSRGQTVRTPTVAIKYIFNNKRDSYRAAVVVSRKVHKSAVVRNRIRRRIYEILRARESAFAGPYDIVITVFSEQVATIEAAGLQTMIAEQLIKAGILQSPQEQNSHAIVEQRQPKERS